MSFSDDDEFRLTLKVRNHPLLSAIEARAATVAEFCRQHGMSQTEVGAYVNLQRSPLNKAGEWRDGARKLADACGVTPEDLFPTAVQIALATNGASFSVAASEAAALLESDQRPDALLEQKEIPALVQAALATLAPREAKVLAYRYGIGVAEHSLEEVGRVFDVSRERIRQIEAKALRKLRHPSRSEALVPLVPETAAYYDRQPEAQDSFSEEAWLTQAIEQNLACRIPEEHRAMRWLVLLKERQT